MDVVINVDLEKFRWSLVGDGYLREEAVAMSEEELVKILKDRIKNHIDEEYDRGERIGLYEEYDEDEEEDDIVTLGDVYAEFRTNYPEWAKEANDWRPFCGPYTTICRPWSILIWMDNGEAKRYSYETKKLYPVEEEEIAHECQTES